MIFPYKWSCLFWTTLSCAKQQNSQSCIAHKLIYARRMGEGHERRPWTSSNTSRAKDIQTAILSCISEERLQDSGDTPTEYSAFPSTELYIRCFSGANSRKKARVWTYGRRWNGWNLEDSRSCQSTLAMKILHKDITSITGPTSIYWWSTNMCTNGHPNIVPAWTRYPSWWRIYFTMKEIKGRTFQENHSCGAHCIITRSMGVNIMWVEAFQMLDAFHQVCQVWLLHSKGVIHRDLKPANIRIGEVIVDWGIAKILSNKRLHTPQRRIRTKALGRYSYHHVWWCRYPGIHGTRTANGNISTEWAHRHLFLGVILLTYWVVYTPTLERVVQMLYGKMSGLPAKDLGEQTDLKLSRLLMKTLPIPDVLIDDDKGGPKSRRQIFIRCRSAQVISDWLDGSQQRKSAAAITRRTRDTLSNRGPIKKQTFYEKRRKKA